MLGLFQTVPDFLQAFHRDGHRRAQLLRKQAVRCIRDRIKRVEGDLRLIFVAIVEGGEIAVSVTSTTHTASDELRYGQEFGEADMRIGWLVLCIWRWLRNRQRRHAAGRRRTFSVAIRRTAAKPPWVRDEIIRLKALMPEVGCRMIAATFNRRHARHAKVRQRMTVGKSYVAQVVRRHRYEIDVLRREIKHRVPPAMPRNLAWGMDLTGKADAVGNTHSVLGVIDHGTRALLTLAALPNKSSWTLLGHVFLAIGSYGKPRAIRTDNESVFMSLVFRMMLRLGGIRHQRSDPGCPWQNGRIERCFGTLKGKLDRLVVDSFEGLSCALHEFRFFYNHIRPHQHLRSRTPAEAWAGVDPYARPVKQECWFEAWEGLLQGFYLRR